MGSYVKGVYVPTIGETGWGAAVNDFLTQDGGRHVNVKLAPFGAKGDGSTDDSAAIQAAIDFVSTPAESGEGHAAVVFFPPGWYRLGSTVNLKGASILQGSGTGYRAGTRGTTISMTTGATDTTVFHITNQAGITIRDIKFEERESHQGSPATLGTDTGIECTGTVAGCLITGCVFEFLLWAIDSYHASYLINSVQNTNLYAPSRHATNGFVNYNSWINCNFQNLYHNVPAITISGQKNNFLTCRWESVKSSAIWASGTNMLTIRDCYIESTNVASNTNPRDAAMLYPVFDFINSSTPPFDEHGANIYSTIDGVFFIALAVHGVGSTDMSGGHRNLNLRMVNSSGITNDFSTWKGVYTDRQDEDSLINTYASTGFTTLGYTELVGGNTRLNGLKVSQGTGSPEGVLAAPVGSIYMRSDGSTRTTFYAKETGTTTSTGWVALNAMKPLVTLTDAATVAFDASRGSVFGVNLSTSRTIGNPTNVLSGMTVDIEIYNGSGGAMTTTWSGNWHLAGAWVDPANTKRRNIRFLAEDATHFWEVARSAADIS